MRRSTIRGTRKRKTKATIRMGIPEEEKNLPFYERLYPPLKDVFVYDENYEIENKLLKMKSKIVKGSKNFLDDDEQELDEKFLSNLVETPCPIPREKVIDSIANFIQRSKLIEKMQSDYESTEKKTTVSSLSKLCAEKLKFQLCETGEIIFKIGDQGENFYVVLSGNVSVLKLKELSNVQMNYMEYIKYCKYLINQGEEYLLNEVLRANENVLNVSSSEDIKLIDKIVFIKRLNHDISKKITNNKQLKKYFGMNGQKYSKYEINQDELDAYEQDKIKGKQGAGKEWEGYITRKCSLLVSEQVFFQSFENVLTDNEPKNITCYCYEPFLYLGPGLFFGDTALDFENNKRNATIRAEGKTYLAYLQRDDYLNIISPMNKMERIKEIDFIYTNFFFLSINSHIFEKNLFHLFSHKEYYHGNILFSQGNIPNSLILVKSGRISLELRCSIIDIQNLIKFIFDNIFINPIFERLSSTQKSRFMSIQKMNTIKKYINDPVLLRLKTHNIEFINQMKAIKSYTITILTGNDIIGLEEIFIRMPYITKASVISSKVECYELSLNNLDKMLNFGKDIVLSYTKYSINKLCSLIERLQNIKQNYINMALAKFEIIDTDSKVNNNLDIDLDFKTSPKNSDKINKDINDNKINYSYENINSERKAMEIDENKLEIKIKNNLNSPSPIKIFITSQSRQSKNRIEEIKMALSRFKKNQLKQRQSRLMKEIFNYKPKLSKSIEIKKMKSMKNKSKEKKKHPDINNRSSSILYHHDDKLDTKLLIENLFIDNKKGRNKSNKSKEMESESTIEDKNNVSKINKNINASKAKENTFILNYIPINLIFQNEQNNKNKQIFNKVNNLLTIKKNVNQIVRIAKPINSSGNILKINKKNNEMSHSKLKTNNNNVIMNNKRKFFKKKLTPLNKNYSITNISNENKLVKTNNIIPKKIIISGIIKNFYKDIKLNGYSSIIKNKNMNSIYMRKFNKKYDSAEKASQNIKIHLLKNNTSLPYIL